MGFFYVEYTVLIIAVLYMARKITMEEAKRGKNRSVCKDIEIKTEKLAR